MFQTDLRDAPPPVFGIDGIDHAIAKAESALLATQRPDGHFVFELEADVSIPSEYVLFKHFRGAEIRYGIAQKFARYLRKHQTAGGGWPLFEDGGFNISSSVKAYFALKLLGDSPDEPHMVRARTAILKHGGAAQSNVFTRAFLALYGEVPWDAVPVMPVEIMHLPKWFPFHMEKVSYWARTVLAPMMVVNAIRPRARNPLDIHIPELFVTPAFEVKTWPGGAGKSPTLTAVFNWIDKVLRAAEPHMPKGPRARAIAKAEAWTTERLNGTDGLGAIYPAMAYSALMYDALGCSEDDPRLAQALAAIEGLVVEYDDYAYLQPCVSPVWDTSLAAHALMEAGLDRNAKPVKAALDWLVPRQVLDVRGDWIARKPHVRPGGWAFQYNNAHYPDLDDTAVVVMAMDRAQKSPMAGISGRYDATMARAREWVEGLQSRNGAWGAFDADNDYDYLNNIPFADHGALLDPPTADVTARCISMLAQLGETQESSPIMKRAVDYLVRTQEKDGSWFGRWGMNYIYGTWSVLCALNIAKVDPQSTTVRRAVEFLKKNQNEDGGWGEGAETYEREYNGYQQAVSTASQTSWALIALMAAGEVGDPGVARGIDYLRETQGEDGFWKEPRFTATGFPKVFYLRYHGYSKFFPLWALARFRNLTRSNHREVAVGM
ncbi:MAG: squalene--hopene cyclase [Beijerinckiaceae bacterium]|nr:squalene--hopene cyclase [Beijerinckiaceae bacterium]